MSPLQFFDVVTGEGTYTVGYLTDGWTYEIRCKAATSTELVMLTQNAIGSICDVVYVERN